MICKDPALWRVLYFSNPLPRKLLSDYDLMLRRAVDRSQGQLIDLTVHYFGSANLMNHIARRSTNLKRVKLGICFHISGFHAARIFAKLPHLEELHLTLDRAVDIRSIGYACPTLKSFSLNTFNCKFVLLEGADDVISFYRNLCARAIAESMPNLQHLQLFAHWIGNQGLEDILEACPRLESLDVRRCFDLHLEGDLGKRCRERMKVLKLPHD
ncbi:putative F-box/LRR-repeat protein 23 [Salvia splendens]|uniref:putative F-box/LRR-repeat protein 23 n=1 Tax=Salvia splendens TaxID=180675 RepID=UPI001C271A7C|nr:putative F-box/LRR-repeat protein 23 [Salvia splendens]